MRWFHIVLLCLSSSVSWSAPKEELQELRGRIERLQQELAGAEEVKSEAADALKASEQAISSANRALYELDAQHRDISAALDRLHAQSEQLGRMVRGQQARLEKLIYRRYLSGSEDSLRLMLSGRDPAQVSRELYYYTYVSRARSEAIGQLRANLAQLKEVEEATREKAAELATVKTAQVQQKQRLEAERRVRKQVLTKVSGEIAGHRKEIGRLKQDEKRLTRLIDRLTKMLARKRAVPRSTPKRRGSGEQREPEPVGRVDEVPDDSFAGTPFQSLKGRLRLPVIGELANRFGSPRHDSGLTWRGLFIRAQAGQPIRAVADGRVVFADWLRGFGNLMILDHGSGYMSLYGNNESLLKQLGDAIRSGDTIASAGNSGGNQESGLYFELRHQGKPLDPLGWVGK